MNFKASADLNIEGNKQIITREPGIYVVAMSTLAAGTKRTGQGDAAIDVPTIDYTVVVRKVTQLHDKTLNPQEIVGKTHTEQIRLDTITTQEEFDKKVKRIGHVLTKVGISKEDIVKVGFKSPEQYQKDIVALFNPETHSKQTFNYKVIGGVYNGNAFTQAPGYLGFATELGTEQKFSSAEVKGNNEYYAALTGQMPSAEGDSGTGAGAGAGQAF